MSNAYITEPPTKGKVILHTTSGDLEIELWPKEAPKATRNFVQLCLEGYYDGTIFHRVVKGFIVQGGDPEGTGEGGESIYGQHVCFIVDTQWVLQSDVMHSFQMNFTLDFASAIVDYSRWYASDDVSLRSVPCVTTIQANTGANTNGSQFFFTLDRTDELNKRNTIFGKVVGDTIFNLLRMGEAETDANERPLYPTKVIGAEVIANPFDDIEPRTSPQERAARTSAEKAEKERQEQARKPKVKKNVNLLSFGEDAPEEDAGDLPVTKLKSSHDVLDDPRLSKAVAVEIPKEAVRPSQKPSATKPSAPAPKAKRHTRDDDSDDDDSASEDNDYDKKMRERVTKRLKVDRHASDEPDRRDDKRASALQNEIRKVQQEIRGIGKDPSEDPSTNSPKSQKKEKYLDRIRSEYLSSGKVTTPTQKKRSKGGDTDILDRLKSFQSFLSKSDTSETVKKEDDKVPQGGGKEGEEEEWECDLHFVVNCKSCRNTFGEEEEGDEEGWMNAKLVFAKEVGANVYEPKLDDYTVIDPREGAKTGDFTGKAAAEKLRNKDHWREKGLHTPGELQRMSGFDGGWEGGGGGRDGGRDGVDRRDRGRGSGGGRYDRDSIGKWR